MIPHSKPTLDESDYKVVGEVIYSGHIAQGEKVREFEHALASYIGVKEEGVATNSGTSALHLALLALNIKDKDEVIMPTYVCIAPLNAILYTGATPVFVDINEDDFNLSIQEIKQKLTNKTKAIIVPHMFGHPADLTEILNIGVPVIEDCAHSIGASYKNRRVGSFGKLSIFSFYATKMLTTGEGGMVLSNEKQLLSKMRDLREYDKYVGALNLTPLLRVRFNYKMTDISAALGLNQLKRLQFFINKRTEIAKKYNTAFSECPFTTPSVCNQNVIARSKATKQSIGRVFYRYIIRVTGTVERYINEMQEKGIDCKKPAHKPLHQYFGLKFPIAERVHKSAISIPIYPSLTDEEVDFIIKTTIGVLR